MTSFQRHLRVFLPRKARVSKLQALGPSLHLLQIQGPELLELWPMQAGQQISLQVAHTWPRGGRNYTVARCNKEESSLELIVYTAGPGPGARFVRSLELEDSVTVWGPGGGNYGTLSDTRSYYFSDESGVGFGLALLQKRPPFHGYVSVREEATVQALQTLHPELHGVLQSTRSGIDRDAPLYAVAETLPLTPDTRIVLTGRVRSCYALRTLFLERGVPSTSIHVRPFWSDKRRG